MRITIDSGTHVVEYQFTGKTAFDVDGTKIMIEVEPDVGAGRECAPAKEPAPDWVASLYDERCHEGESFRDFVRRIERSLSKLRWPFRHRDPEEGKQSHLQEPLPDVPY